jgi:hypothetical protein
MQGQKSRAGAYGMGSVRRTAINYTMYQLFPRELHFNCQ